MKTNRGDFKVVNDAGITLYYCRELNVYLCEMHYEEYIKQKIESINIKRNINRVMREIRLGDSITIDGFRLYIGR